MSNQMNLRSYYRLVVFGMTSLLVIGAIVDGRWLLLGLFLAYGYAVYRAALELKEEE